MGVVLSRCINTVRPLSSSNSLNSMRFWAVAMLLTQSDIPKDAEMVKILFIVLYDINSTFWMFMRKHMQVYHSWMRNDDGCYNFRITSGFKCWFTVDCKLGCQRSTSINPWFLPRRWV